MFDAVKPQHTSWRNHITTIRASSSPGLSDNGISAVNQFSQQQLIHFCTYKVNSRALRYKVKGQLKPGHADETQLTADDIPRYFTEKTDRPQSFIHCYSSISQHQ